jgi:hypothetical protein
MKKLLLAGAAIMMCSSASADEHMIRPTCWEENVNGEVHRHCEVQREPSPSVSAVPEPSQAIPQPPSAAVPPPQYSYGSQYDGSYLNPSGRPPTSFYHGPFPNPPGYYGPPPAYFQPGYGYYPGPLGIPGPLAVFRFGPFRFVIP